MSEPINAEAISDANAPDIALSTNEETPDVFAELKAFYTQDSDVQTNDGEDSGEVENLSEPETETVPESEDSGEESEPEKPEETQADFKALEREREFPDEEALKIKYPRNANKDLVAEAAKFAAQAKDGWELSESLGGEAFIPSMKTIAAGVRDGDPIKIFEGLGQADDTAFANTLTMAMDLALIRGKQLAEHNDESVRAYGENAAKLGDVMIESRFGINSETIERLAKFNGEGWIDFLSDAIENERIDYDKFHDLLTATTAAPEVKELLKEKETLKKQLDAQNAKKEEENAKFAANVETSFNTSIDESFEKVLNDIVLKTSVLGAKPNDSDEVKASKQLLRGVLAQNARNHFNQSDKRKSLLEQYKSGASHTAKYADGLAKAIDESVLATKADTVIAEKLIAKLYGASRNARLLQNQTPSQTEMPPKETPQPTQTTDFRTERKSGDVSRDVLEELTAFYAGQG